MAFFVKTTAATSYLLSRLHLEKALQPWQRACERFAGPRHPTEHRYSLDPDVGDKNPRSEPVPLSDLRPR
eukprot:728552-Amphidinium_carterae.1